LLLCCKQMFLRCLPNIFFVCVNFRNHRNRSKAWWEFGHQKPGHISLHCCAR
jgi:hypothetical protein